MGCTAGLGDAANAMALARKSTSRDGTRCVGVQHCITKDRHHDHSCGRCRAAPIRRDQGAFVNDTRLGEGILYHANGDTYRGKFGCGKYHITASLMDGRMRRRGTVRTAACQ